MTDSTLLIRNADLLCTMNPADAGALEGSRPGDNAGAEIRGGGLFARDGVIEMVGPGDTLPDSADTVIDMTGHVVIPGMVNTHHHLFQNLTRAVPAAREYACSAQAQAVSAVRVLMSNYAEYFAWRGAANVGPRPCSHGAHGK